MNIEQIGETSSNYIYMEKYEHTYMYVYVVYFLNCILYRLHNRTIE